MAAVAVGDLDPARRRVFVDFSRWDAVVRDFVSTTSVASAGAQVAAFTGQPKPELVRSGSLRVDVSSLGKGATGTVSVTLLSDKGYPLTTRVRVTRPGTMTATLASCAIGCSVISVDLTGGLFRLAGVSAGHTRILRSTSHSGGTSRALSLSGGSPPQAVLVTPGLRMPKQVPGMDGRSLPVRVLGTVTAVPLLGRDGYLLDLARNLRGAVGTVAGTRSVVLARADTPASVLATLHRDGGGTATTYAATADRLAHTPPARADSLALLIAGGIALVALTHLLAWLASQSGRRRAEVAGLRIAGIRPRAVRRAYLTESAILAAIVLVTATVTAAATTVPLLKAMTLVGGWADAPVLHPHVRPITLAVVVVVAALVTAAICGLAFSRFGRGARPSALRASER
jgi:hypothetical protein